MVAFQAENHFSFCYTMRMHKGTKENPWQLKTPPLSSEYHMYLDEKDGQEVIVCIVGKTTLLYDKRA